MRRRAEPRFCVFCDVTVVDEDVEHGNIDATLAAHWQLVHAFVSAVLASVTAVASQFNFQFYLSPKRTAD